MRVGLSSETTIGGGVLRSEKTADGSALSRGPNTGPTVRQERPSCKIEKRDAPVLWGDRARHGAAPSVHLHLTTPGPLGGR